MKWHASEAHYFINADGEPAGSIPALQAAMQTWTNVSSANFALIYDGTTQLRPGQQRADGTNVIGFAPMGTSDGTLAETLLFYNSVTGQLTETDITFNTNFPWATNGSSGAYDLQDVATHEMGHCHGLDDLYSDGDMYKTMYGYSSEGEISQRILSRDDINGVTYLYPGFALPVPATANSYSYPQSPDPVFDADPSQNRPFTVGDVVHGTLSLHASSLPFDGLVDIYLAIYAPFIDSNIWLIRPDNSLQRISDGLVPWRARTGGQVDEMLFGDIPLSSMPKGAYFLYALVTPADSPVTALTPYYFWSTSFTIP
ncbi:MAG TPA: matrixin family metalloprotease [Thermodesulfovibrionales bacterium]|nr:matrixin family metalloprotease [Thermodesulfovibrionales bacterium]